MPDWAFTLPTVITPAQLAGAFALDAAISLPAEATTEIPLAFRLSMASCIGAIQGGVIHPEAHVHHVDFRAAIGRNTRHGQATLPS